MGQYWLVVYVENGELCSESFFTDNNGHDKALEFAKTKKPAYLILTLRQDRINTK